MRCELLGSNAEALKMEAECSSETLVSTYKSIRRYYLEHQIDTSPCSLQLGLRIARLSFFLYENRTEGVQICQ
jgi:hypothetical protein